MLAGEPDYIERSVSIALSAQQVILAFVAIFFAVSYPEIDRPIRHDRGVDTGRIANAIRDLDETLWSRVIPLILVNVLALTIFAPVGVRIVVDTWSRVGPYLGDFDVGRTAFVLINLLLLYFFGWSCLLPGGIARAARNFGVESS